MSKLIAFGWYGGKYNVEDISQWQVEHKARQKAFLALRQAAESADLQ